MRPQIIIIYFSAFIISIYGNEKKKNVDTTQGRIEGKLSEDGLCYKYLGIRYGVPVRFRAPKDPPCHSDVYKADNNAVICAQFPSNDPLAAPSLDEDCLILNVFTPSFITNASLPVMVYLHGGDFGVGASSSEFYGPQYLISHSVVVVTVNYRLNVYGFLNLGIKEAPGNAGLKDIRLALRWIRDNIGQFNGDPENVTVFGQGSGGIAAIYLTLSQSTKGLFHRIISQSGSLFGPQAFDSDGLKTASQVAKSLEVNTEDPMELFKVYSETEVRKVEEAIGNLMNAKSVFLPTVEEAFDDEEPFLTDTPFNILTTPNHKDFNPVPIIIGLNTVEGLTSTLDYYTITSQMDRIKHEDFSALDQRSLHVPEDEKEEFRTIIKDTYFTNISSDESLIGGIINLNTDFSYVGPISLFSELYANKTDVAIYEYIFNYIGNRNLGKLLTNSSLEATTNRDELFYIFELERVPLPIDEDDARIITFMTTMWTNFAKYGSPTPDPSNGEWLPYPHHLAISLEPQYVSPLTQDRAYFWRAFYYKYGVDVRKWNFEDLTVESLNCL